MASAPTESSAGGPDPVPADADPAAGPAQDPAQAHVRHDLVAKATVVDQLADRARLHCGM
ncbi:hypothetical protein [Arthrobacter agilis]|uniref:hypothetical protein n=1 Tax=Arthrobacter agilis TaxID=37921 RepID=UPI00277E92A2|nr:hypothetical protein [Arthrobacter agilis]MDQ0734330.1 hypothetical protein [Arthrobacter agilis]